jgi:hypothetical protein
MQHHTLKNNETMTRLLYIVLLALCWACADDAREKHQGSRNKVINVRGRVKEIMTEDVLLSGSLRSHIIDNYVILEDFRSPDEMIHLFDKNTFAYVTSTANMGQGPGEITVAGNIAVDEARRTFYLTDNAKWRIFAYSLDSVLTNPHGYLPEVKVRLNQDKFPVHYDYINDTLCIGRIMEPVGVADYREAMGKWNMLTGEIRLMPYEHPNIRKKRITYAVSVEHGIYVECHLYRDLMTICTLDGELKYNIYGPKWSETPAPYDHYDDVQICGDKIVATYSGKGIYSTDKNGQRRMSNYPTQFLVFDLEGNNLRTLETGYNISNFCYDKANHRLILTLNDDPQVAYLDLGEVGL